MRQHWEADELIEHWGLSPVDLSLIRDKTGPTRLGFTVLLKHFESEGRFPASPDEVPVEVVAFLAAQLGVPADVFDSYRWAGRTAQAHRAQVRARFGFREATNADADELASWLAAAVLPTGERRDHWSDLVAQRCRELRIEPPSPGQIARVVGSATRRFEEQFCAATTGRLGAATVAALDALVAEDRGEASLTVLQADPGRASLDTLLAALCWSRSREVTDALAEVSGLSL